MQNEPIRDFKTYKTNYQTMYLESDQKYGRCDDCNTFGLLIETGKCSDIHLYNIKCCVKYTCISGCTYFCKMCGIPNNVVTVDGYCNSFTCFNCYADNLLNVQWSGGSLMQNCDRYCNCSVKSWDGVVIGMPVKNMDTSKDWCSSCGYCDGSMCLEQKIDTYHDVNNETAVYGGCYKCYECESNKKNWKPKVYTEFTIRSNLLDQIETEIDFRTIEFNF